MTSIYDIALGMMATVVVTTMKENFQKTTFDMSHKLKQFLKNPLLFFNLLFCLKMTIILEF